MQNCAWGEPEQATVFIEKVAYPLVQRREGIHAGVLLCGLSIIQQILFYITIRFQASVARGTLL